MKRCPDCRRDYFDDSLLYCLDDGAALLEGPASMSSSDGPKTEILHKTDSPGQAATQPLLHTTHMPALRQAKPRARLGFILAGIVVLIIGGFLGYRYLFTGVQRQITSIA